MRSLAKWLGLGSLALVLAGVPGAASAAGWHGGGTRMAPPVRAAPVGGTWRGGGAVYGRGYAPGYVHGGGYRYAPGYVHGGGYRYAPGYVHGGGYRYAPGYVHGGYHWGYGPRVWIGTTWAYPPHPGWTWIAAHWAWTGYNWAWQAGYWAPPAY
jgi:hypothetical protein